MKAVGLLRFYSHHEIELSGYELIILQDEGRRTWKWFGDWQGHCCTTGPGDRVSSFSVLKDKASLVSGGQDATAQSIGGAAQMRPREGDDDATSVGLEEDHWANKDCLGTLRSTAICLVTFWTCLGPVVPSVFPVSPFWNGNVYPLPVSPFYFWCGS